MKSIMHDKSAGTCYLCMVAAGDYQRRTELQEHHVIFGTSGRKLSEKYGLKVYLCAQHHTIGPAAVHNNQQIARYLQAEAQEAFEKQYGHEKWMQVFGRNYKEVPLDTGFIDKITHDYKEDI